MQLGAKHIPFAILSLFFGTYLLSVGLQVEARPFTVKNLFPLVLPFADRAQSLNEEAERQLKVAPQQAIATAKQAVQLAIAARDQTEETRALIILSAAHLELAKYRDAIGFAERAAKLARKIGNRVLLAKALHLTGTAHRLSGNYPQAFDALLKALQVSEEGSDLPNVAASLNTLGVLSQNLGDHRQALDCFLRALAINQQIKDKNRIAGNFNNIGLAYDQLGELAKATDYFERALRLKYELGDKPAIARTLNNLGILHHKTSQYEKAIDAHQQSLAIKKLAGLLLENRDHEINLAERDQELQAMALKASQEESAQAAKEIALLQRHIDLQSQYRNALIVATIAALILLAVILNRYHLIKKSEMSMKGKHEEILRQKVKVEQLANNIQEANHRLEELAMTDPLTKVRNRRFFYQVMGKEIARAERDSSKNDGRRPRQELIFFLIDLDQFKQINDRYGHEVGDLVLVETAKRLSSITRQSDYVIRWGGEEFLIVSRYMDCADGQRLADRLLTVARQQPVTVQNLEIGISLSIGWASWPEDFFESSPTSYADALRLADRALYMAKRQGRDTAVGLLPTRNCSLASLSDGMREQAGEMKLVESRAINLISSNDIAPPPPIAQSLPTE